MPRGWANLTAFAVYYVATLKGHRPLGLLVFGARFRIYFALEDGIGPHTCLREARTRTTRWHASRVFPLCING
jgi:hypothetical protein